MRKTPKSFKKTKPINMAESVREVPGEKLGVITILQMIFRISAY